MKPLQEMFHYHAWSTLTLMDYCSGLAAETLSTSVPGTFGPIMDTFIHLVAADQRYLQRLTDKPLRTIIYEDNPVSLPELRQAFEAQMQLWESVLERVDQLDVTLPARGDWPETAHAQNLLLLQAIHHGNDHRTHICSALSILGLEPPDIDGWSYWFVTYHSAAT